MIDQWVDTLESGRVISYLFVYVRETDNFMYAISNLFPASTLINVGGKYASVVGHEKGVSLLRQFSQQISNLYDKIYFFAYTLNFERGIRKTIMR